MATVGAILVVDDNVELAENVVEILEVAGYEAVLAASAEAALLRVAQGGIGALITDFRLPGLTGAELIIELRRSGCRIPMAVMSAYTDAANVQRAEAAGALDVMPKPLDLGRLRRLVATFDEVSL
jgi:DNA-binding NtrC family response regulator